MTTKLARIAEKAKTDRTTRFTSLAHLLTPEFLLETWRQMNHKGASGVDGETTKEIERDLETRVQQLHTRLKERRYRPPPVRRVEIPKGNGKTRPLGIPTVEDRLGKVRHVYEADIRGYFNHINHAWLRKMVAHRIADPVITSLIGKWLRAGVMQDGVVSTSH